MHDEGAGKKKLKCLNIELSKQKKLIPETKNASQISEKRGSLCDKSCGTS